MIDELFADTVVICQQEKLLSNIFAMILDYYRQVIFDAAVNRQHEKLFPYPAVLYGFTPCFCLKTFVRDFIQKARHPLSRDFLRLLPKGSDLLTARVWKAPDHSTGFPSHAQAHTEPSTYT